MVQSAVKNLCDALTATAQYIKQTHLCAAEGGYSTHKITNDIYEHLNDAVDRLKELYISIYQDKSIAKASSSFASALSYLQLIPDLDDVDNPQTMINNCVALLNNLVEYINRETTNSDKGLENALGDICETIERDKYLLQMERKNGK